MHYLSKQNKSYRSVEEFNMRLENFIAIDQFIEEWNSQEDKTHTAGHNFLSDWSEAERSKITPKKVAKTPKRHTKSVA